MAASATALAALAVTLIGRYSTPQRGFDLWCAALWCSAVGILLGALWPRALALAQVLLVQWPLLTLVGMRRFHARLDWPGRERHDWILFGGCVLMIVLGAVLGADSALAPILAPAAALLAHLYVASLLICAGTRPEARPTHLLGAVIALAACAPMVATVPGIDSASLFGAGAVTAALASVAMAFIVTTLIFDRSERHLRASRRRLRALASTDPLTQVPNRRHFEELAVRALEHDPPASAVLVMFDIDHFKRINDHYGHAGGDRALRLVARCVREVLRVQDVPCRHGGDEFALLLRHARVHDAMRVASRLVERVQTLTVDAALPQLSLSFGVVQLRPAETLLQALQRADQALYEAKRQGRSRAVATTGEASAPQVVESRPMGLSHA